MNEYDSSKMVDMMCTERDMEQTKDPSETDLILLNTCSIRKNLRKGFFTARPIKPLKNQILSLSSVWEDVWQVKRRE